MDTAEGSSHTMFVIISTILSLVLTAACAFLAALVFFIAPRFTRRSLVYEHDESVPVINEHARSSELTVTYHGDFMSDPHVIQFKLENSGRRDVPSSAFDQAAPLEFDFGVKIAAILHVSYQPPSMVTPNVLLDERALSIGPSLIPRGSILEYLLLVDGSCDAIVCTSPLEDVLVKERMPGREKGGIRLQTILTYAAVAFVIWWVIQQPSNSAHLVHNVGSLLSAAATRLSRFVSSI
jgi:hypothetical protein